MVQVENEPGTWDGVRDYSPAAQALFNGAVPGEVLAAMGKMGVKASATWRQVLAKTRMNISTCGASRNS